MSTPLAPMTPPSQTPPLAARLSTALIDACERGLLPDALVRAGMRSLMKQRLIDEGLDQPPLGAGEAQWRCRHCSSQAARSSKGMGRLMP